MTSTKTLLAVLLLAFASPVRSQTTETAMAVVAALRAPSSAESAAAIRLGLKDADARVRAAAGRVASVSDPSRFTGELTAALSSETAEDAAREEAWALAIADPGSALGPILRAADRDAIREAVLEALGAALGSRMPELWPVIPKSLLALASPALVRGTRRTGNVARIAPLVLRDELIEGWRELLAHPSLDPVVPGLLLAGLDSPASQIRVESYVALLGEPTTIDGDRELKPATDRQERIARRLFEATRGMPTNIQLEREIALATDEDARLATRLRVLLPKESAGMTRVRGGLTPSEASALLGWIDGWMGGHVGVTETIRVTSRAASSPSKAWGRGTATVGTVKGLPTGFAAAVLKEWGCGSEDRSIVASVVFREDGRPAEIQMASRPGDRGCGAAAQALFSAALGSLPKGRAVLVLPANRSSLECFAATRSDEWAPGPSPVMRAAAYAADSGEPVKKANAWPEYSAARGTPPLWGDLSVQGVLGRSGCVVAMEGFRASEGTQDLIFIDTVSRWKFSPATFRGQPTPIRIGVTGSFVLN